MVKISLKNSKLGRIRNVSLPPIKGCRSGVPCHRKCYAMKAYRQYDQTRAAWDHNLQQYQQDPRSYFDSIYEQLRNLKPNYFRWHVAGDALDLRYVEGMIDIANALPDWHFLAFTKQYDLFNQLMGEIPANLNVFFSQWDGLTLDNPHNFPVAYYDKGDGFICPGSCKTCKHCWHSCQSVVFPSH